MIQKLIRFYRISLAVTYILLKEVNAELNPHRHFLFKIQFIVLLRRVIKLYK
jgi:hypothetical protein